MVTLDFNRTKEDMTLLFILLLIRIPLINAQGQCNCSFYNFKTIKTYLCEPYKNQSQKNCTKEIDFRRTYYQGLDLRYIRNIKDIEMIKYNSYLAKLSITHSEMTRMFCNFNQFGVSYLDLSYNEITRLDKNVTKCANVDRIVEFKIAHNLISYIELNYFNDMNILETLDLSYNKLLDLNLNFLLRVRKFELFLGYNLELSQINMSFSSTYLNTTLMIYNNQTSIVTFPNIYIKEKIWTLYFFTHFNKTGFEFYYSNKTKTKNIIECVENCHLLTKLEFITSYKWAIYTLNLTNSGFRSIPNITLSKDIKVH